MSLDDDWCPDPFPESRTTTENKGNKQPFRKPIVSVKPSRNIVLRKFPGPAGIILPNSDLSSSEIPCTQRSMSLFEDGPWEEMMKDFESNQLPVRYNIKWIKTKATLNQLANWKAPFLAAIVQAIECSESINVILKDMTGEIQAAVIHSLYEEHSENFKVGSVIILKHFGVLTTGQSSNHCLTITSKNLVCIYANNQESDEGCSVRKIEIQSFDSPSISNTRSSSVSEDFGDDFQIPDDFEDSAFRNFEKRDSQQRNGSQTIRMTEGDGLHRITRNKSLRTVSGDSGVKMLSEHNPSRVSGDNNHRVTAENIQRVAKHSPHEISSDSGFSKGDSSRGRNLLDSSFEDSDLPFTQISADLDQGTSPKKFKFRPCKKDKPRDVIVNCSQVSVKTSEEHSSIWQSVLQDVDEDVLFGDF